MDSIDVAQLKDSKTFLQNLYDNVTSAIFIADNNATIYHFNNSFKTLFYKPEDEILQQLCGNVMGCIFQVEEQKNCGNTSQCKSCILRNSIIKTLTEHVPVYKMELERKFYIQGKLIQKQFVFTTKYVCYQEQEMILIILDDITEREEMKKQLELQNEVLKKKNNDLELMLESLSSEYNKVNTSLAGETVKKEQLIREMQHRVGNSLQLISSLLSLKSRFQGNSDVPSLVEFIQQKSQCISLIHRYLHENEEGYMINVCEYLLNVKIVAEKLFAASFIECSFPDTDISLSLEYAASLGILFHEVVTVAHRTDQDVRILLCIRKKGNTADISINSSSGFSFLREGFSADLVRLLVQQVSDSDHLDIDSDTLHVSINSRK